MQLAQGTRDDERILPAFVVAALALVALAASAITIIGSDALWLPALGDRIWDRIWDAGGVPAGIPFAAAPSGDWVNTTVLGQMLLSVVHKAGSIGLVAANVAMVLGALTALAMHARICGARASATALVILTVTIGAAASLFIARAQLLSLVPFALLLVLVRRQADRPTAAIWWAVPLIAVWSNLHGAVLVGVAILGCYLLFSRLPLAPLTAVAVGISSLLATCLNPGLVRAPHYYVGVLTGEATSDDSGMWSRISFANPFDVLLLLAAIGLAAVASRRRRSLWEYAAGLGLIVATASAARHGVWLLLFLAAPAAATVGTASPFVRSSRRSPARPVAIALALVLGSCTLLALRAPNLGAVDHQSAQVAEATKGEVVLAPEPLVESLAAAGATIWMSNPLDAFTTPDQAAYLAFLRGDAMGAERALAHADVVVAQPGTAQSQLALQNGFRRTDTIGALLVMRRA